MAPTTVPIPIPIIIFLLSVIPVISGFMGISAPLLLFLVLIMGIWRLLPLLVCCRPLPLILLRS